jgi:four helix bundle protein
MFDFEKLAVYQKAKTYNKEVNVLISNSKLDRTTNDQIRRASFSIMLNIAEGTGRFTNPESRKPL